MSDLIIESRRDAAAILQFNRPDKRNALSTDLLVELNERLVRLDDDDEVRGVILTGDKRAFSAGADLGGALEAQSPRATDRLLMHFTVANDTIEAMTKPVVAAINGYASPVVSRSRWHVTYVLPVTIPGLVSPAPRSVQLPAQVAHNDFRGWWASNGPNTCYSVASSLTPKRRCGSD